MKWEYEVANLGYFQVKEVLDEMGEQGWELVSVVDGHGGPIGYFRRRSAISDIKYVPWISGASEEEYD